MYNMTVWADTVSEKDDAKASKARCTPGKGVSARRLCKVAACRLESDLSRT